MTTLYALILSLVSLNVSGHGPAIMPRNIRQLGGEAYLLRIEAAILEAADAVDMPPAVLAVVVHAESGFDYRAKSRLGARGLMQLLPGMPHYREWRSICTLSPDDCEGANLLIGARLLKHNWRVCGAGWSAAIARYRGLRCMPRRQEVRLAANARKRGTERTRLMAWEVGRL